MRPASVFVFGAFLDLKPVTLVFLDKAKRAAQRLIGFSSSIYGLVALLVVIAFRSIFEVSVTVSFVVALGTAWLARTAALYLRNYFSSKPLLQTHSQLGSLRSRLFLWAIFIIIGVPVYLSLERSRISTGLSPVQQVHLFLCETVPKLTPGSDLCSAYAGTRLAIRQRLAAEEVARRTQTTEEAARLPLTAEEAARQRLAAEEAERQRLAAEEAERQRLAAEEAERQRLAAEEAERQRLAAEEAEHQRLAAEEAARQRLAAEEAERQRLAAEEAERQRLAAEEAEHQRLAAEEAERQRLAAEEAERQRLAAEEAERQRLAAEEAERQRLAAEEAERQRLAAEEAERQRLAAEEAEHQRLAAEEAERQRLAAEEAEPQRLAAEEAERQRLAAEEAERQRLAAEEAERQRLAAEEAERQRLAAEEAERQRLAAEEAERQRLAAEEAERQRLAAEKKLSDLDFQRELARLGCLPGPLDGAWGRRTSSALERVASVLGEPLADYQRDANLLNILKTTKDNACAELCKPSETLTERGCVAPARNNVPRNQDCLEVWGSLSCAE
ncbi:hypothetical protein K3727_09665 [Rhodobacteraceae bacterium M382]|nr:hypothetical protein K3727_09665 [Rhodobacteraceae bacterium M382]